MGTITTSINVGPSHSMYQCAYLDRGLVGIASVENSTINFIVYVVQVRLLCGHAHLTSTSARILLHDDDHPSSFDMGRRGGAS